MAVAGNKKFKDIYDSGVKALSDIETQSIEGVRKAKEKHSDAQKESSRNSLKLLEDKSSLLQNELKQSINDSLKKLENTLILENTQSEAFVSSLVSELKMLTEQMKLKLLALKQSHQENVDSARTLASEQYLTDSEELSFELEQSLSQSIDYITNQGNSTLDNFDSKLEKLLSQILSDVDNTMNTNLLSSKDNMNTIEEHSLSLQQLLSTDNQSRLKNLQAVAHNANQDVESSVRSLLEMITNHATVIEKQINFDYDQITTAHYQNADNRLSNCADELSELHDSITEQLVSHTDQFSTDLLNRAKQVQQGLQTNCDEVVRQVDTSFEGFKNNQTERLEYSRGQKQALEGDKHKVVMAIQGELVSIQKSFAKKIATVFEQSKSELTEITGSIEEQIGRSIQSFDEQMDSSTQTIQKQIEDEVTKFLNELISARNDAISEITVAAKGNKLVSTPPRSDINGDTKLESTKPTTLKEDIAAEEENSWLEDNSPGLDNNPNKGKNQFQNIADNSSLSDNTTERHRRHKENKE